MTFVRMPCCTIMFSRSKTDGSTHILFGVSISRCRSTKITKEALLMLRLIFAFALPGSSCLPDFHHD